MISRLLFLIVMALVLGFAPVSSSFALSGDADGNGVLNVDDARFIARFLTHQVSALPNPVDADATQDGKVDMEDAFVIAKRLTGQTRIVVVAPDFGSPEVTRVGETLRIQVFEKFFPFTITSGTVRIQSPSSGYDSGDKPLTVDQDGRSLFYHWDTAGLKPVSDYQISVNLGPSSTPIAAATFSTQSLATTSTADATVALSGGYYAPGILASVTDASAPTPGIPLVFSRINQNDSSNYVYDGPFGKGWLHSYDIFLTEFTDGKISISGLNRTFTAKGGGIYQSRPGDYGVLTRNADGSFQLKEKNGLTYIFLNNLKLYYIIDVHGNKITAEYDNNNRLTKVMHSTGYFFKLDYNAAGHIVKLTDHAGRITTYEYRESICPVNGLELNPPCKPQSTLEKVTDPSGSISKYTYLTGLSALSDYRLKTVEYPDGTMTQYDIDSNARLTKVTGYWGANPLNYSYGSDGFTTITDALGVQNKIQVNDRLQPILQIAPDGGKTSNTYDNAANLIVSTDPLVHSTQFSYDELGNVTQVTNPLGNSVKTGYDLRFNKPSTITDSLGHITSYTYDTSGNLTKTLFSDETSENYTYDEQGNPLSFQNAGGKLTQYVYNTQGQVTSRTDALNHLTQFAYDPSSDLKTITDAKGHAVSNARDALGRLTKRTYTDGSHEDYAYDASGKITAVTNRRGQTITFAYDKTGRLESKTYQSGKKLQYFYDNTGYLARVEHIESGNTTTEAIYEYDALHRVTFVKVPGKTVPLTYDMSYRYDLAGNRIQAFYPDGYELNYSYDAANRLTRIYEANGNTIVTYEYDAAGRRTKRTLGNGTYATYSYNSLNQLTEVVNYAPDYLSLSANKVVQSRFAYDYNPTGLRTRMTTLEGQHNYSYDDTNQLTQVQYPDSKTVKYDFDAVGNRTQVTENGTPTAYTTNDLDQYSKVGNQTLNYDGNGNLATQTVGTQITAYGWDEDDRLVSVDKNGVHVDFRYNHQGHLVGKSFGGVDTRYVWDGIHIAAEMDNSGNILRRFVYGAKIDEILVVTAGSAKFWAQQDGLGSVVGTTDNSGITIATISYDVYGNVRGGDLGSVPQRFAGMFEDQNIQAYITRIRWYSPSLGRFLSHDIFKGTINTNLYYYANNNPTNIIDLLGGQAITVEQEEVLIALDEGHKFADDFETLEVYIAMTKAARDYQETIPHDTQQWVQIIYNKDAKEASVNPNGQSLTENGSDKIIIVQGTIDGKGLTTQERSEINQIIDSSFNGHLSPGGSNVISGSNPGKGYVWIPTGGGTGGWTYTNGGLCPTFVQGGKQQSLIAEANPQAKLTAKMLTPWSQSLLRSDIPIFGLAKGQNFAKYRVEYGKGEKPEQWQTIVESDKPQETAPSFGDISWMQGDIDIKGNLATWNTGFNEWVHLPWHPAEDPTDLNGVYTVRLTVFGKDGQQVEDRVTGEVGRAIAQSSPGYAISPDHRVALRFSEQAISDAFRVYTILPTTEVGEETPAACEGCELLGPVYRIREPGDRFIKDVALEFTLKPEELGGRKPEQIGIAHYDVEKKQWVWTDSRFDKVGALFSTTLTQLPAPKAIYALMYKKGENHATVASPPPAAPAMLKPVRPGVLVEDDFERDFGSFKPRDHFVGAVLIRDKDGTKDGSYALKFTNANFGGNFSSTVLDQPFDVREHNVLKFDYRIKPGVKVDFYLKVNGRWHRLIFTGDPFDFRNRDVNIGNFGWIEGVIADDQWHTAGVDLYYFLSQQTRHTRVDEIMMADWRVDGYRKLEFGTNPRESAYYIDNFHIAGKGKVEETPAVLRIDGFNEVRNKNELGNMTGVYATPGTNFFQVGLIDVPETGTSSQTAKKGKARDRALNLAYEFMQEGAFGGYWTSLTGVDLAKYTSVALRLYAPGDLPPLKIGIRGKQGKQDMEGKAALKQYASPPDAGGWREVHVPLTALRGIWQFTAPDVLFISGAYQEGRGKGNVWIDDLRFEQTPNPKVADFESPENWTALGGDTSIHENGAAALSARPMQDPDKPGNTILRIAYGGSIGKDYGAKGGGFSYASWDAGLNGTDARPFKYLSLRIRGENGGETPNFYLNDAITRYPLRIKDLQPITKDWQTLRLPLAFYAEHGVDLSHVESLQMVFEWTGQTGTVYVDDIGLE